MSRRRTSHRGSIHDFGPVFAHRTPAITHRFPIENTTGRTVAILGESHSCACTKINIDKKSLKPGQRAVLTMTVEVPPDYSYLELISTVKTDHPTFPAWTYRLRLESFPRARVEPRRVDLGIRGPGEEEAGTASGMSRHADAFLEVYGSTREPLPTPDTGSLRIPGGLAVDLERPPRLETVAEGVTRARYALKFGWKPSGPSPAGAHSRSITIPLSDGSACGAQVDWLVASRYEVDPAVIHFGTFSPASPARDVEIRLRSIDHQPFAIVAVESDSKCVDRSGPEGLPTPPAPEQILTLTLRPDLRSDRRAYNGQVRIRTDRAGDDVIVVPWSAFSKEPVGATDTHSPSPPIEERRGS